MYLETIWYVCRICLLFDSSFFSYLSNNKIIATILVNLLRASHRSGDFMYIISSAHHFFDKAVINVSAVQTEKPRADISV